MQHKWGRGFIALAVHQPDIRLLQIQLLSLIELEYREWDCLIGIDGIDVEVEKLINEMVMNDNRFKVITFEKNVGFYRNFERVLFLTPQFASWVALCDQDDRWYPDKFGQLLPALETVDLVYGSAELVVGNSRKGKIERTTSGLGQLIINNSITGCTVIFRRDLLDFALPFPKQVDSSFHDHWIGVVAMSRNGISKSDLVVQDYVQHDNNVIGEESKTAVFVRLEKLRKVARNKNLTPLKYLLENRWGWRVSMAKSVLSTNIVVSKHNEQVLRTFAKGRFSFSLMRITFSNISRRNVPIIRGISLLVTSLFALFQKQEATKS